MLYLPQTSNVPQRVHGALVTEDEVIRVVDFLQQQLGSWQDQEPLALSLLRAAAEKREDELDPLFDDAVVYVRTAGRASQPSLQRQFKISYQRAIRIISTMEQRGIIGPADNNARHRVLTPSSIQDHP
ncbi:DNA translocase FtsK [Chromatium okenii]